MSHYALIEIKLSNPDKSVLKEAVKLLAKYELGIEPIVKEQTTLYAAGARIPVDILLEYSLPYGNGYGIKIDKGKVQVHVDEHGAPLSAREFAKLLQQYYTAIATMIAVRRHGYQVKLDKVQDKLIVVAMR